MYDAGKSYLNVGDNVVFNASGYLVYGTVTGERTRNKKTYRQHYNYATHKYDNSPLVESIEEVEITYRPNNGYSVSGTDKKTWTSNSRAVLKI